MVKKILLRNFTSALKIQDFWDNYVVSIGKYLLGHNFFSFFKLDFLILFLFYALFSHKSSLFLLVLN